PRRPRDGAPVARRRRGPGGFARRLGVGRPAGDAVRRAAAAHERAALSGFVPVRLQRAGLPRRPRGQTDPRRPEGAAGDRSPRRPDRLGAVDGAPLPGARRRDPPPDRGQGARPLSSHAGGPHRFPLRPGAGQAPAGDRGGEPAAAETARRLLRREGARPPGGDLRGGALSGTLFGIHPVLEAIRARPRSITRVLVAAGRHDARVEGLVSAARRAVVVVERQPREAIDRLADGGVHQGVVALVSGAEYADPEQVLERATAPALLLVLDGVEDPRNLGAVIRSAAAAGADGVFLPSHGAAGLGAVAVKASAGAVERLPVARVGNVVAFLKRLKERGVWVGGLDPEGPTSWTAFDLAQPVALVVGGGGRGLRGLARDTW